MAEQTEQTGKVLPFRAAVSGRSWYSLETKEDAVEVSIYDGIGFWGVDPASLIRDLQAIDGEGKTVRLHINSPGGDVFGGYAIGNAISRMKAETVAHIDGIAASIASIIAISADRVVMPKNSMMMIHAPWTETMGNAAEHRRTIAALDKIEGQIVAAYEDRAARTLGEARTEGVESFAALVAAESYLTAEDCLALGLADEVVEAVAIAACIRPDVAAKFVNAAAVAQFVMAVEVEDEPAAPASSDEEDGADVAADAPAEVEADTAAQDDAPEEEAEITDAEVAAIEATCAAFDMSDRAPGYIQARTDLETIRAELKRAARKALVAADEALEVNTKIAPAAPDDAEIAASRSLNHARNAGVKAMRGQR
ncbi:head maturation protease, ClpP-related [Paracoccus beibuensis]|uniref:head maturation protease, ClpP-related n=1 Tax=Paracoccus beibuensis TaxID=547602 RepID=UPI002240DD0A|nr:head maturation protease, ClpP-related [Paracoccus beibuensis]